MPTLRSPRVTRRAIVAKASFSDDEDAITPCSSPPPEPQDVAVPSQQPSQQVTSTTILKKSNSYSAASSRKTSTAHSWHFDPTEGEEMDDWHLWQRMLEIQRTFHCYNSARMSAALLELEMGVDAGHLAPSRSCLDLMNESVSAISEEERHRLSEWLHANPPKKRRSGIWKHTPVF
ncbi:hypothetical protein N0V82_008316 [Gnomoniopsis sp. IMI 355080]|nr:hypothetical protein N0V82_008316 [Gnomoniopsis sp. IMI 355080]